jgi:hypothetical protein
MTATVASGPILAAPLRVKVVQAGTNRPVKSTINVRLETDEVKRLGDTAINGERTFSFECVGDTKIQALPTGPSYDRRPDEWFDCRGDPVHLDVSPVLTFAAMGAVDFSNYAQSARLEALFVDAQGAAKQGDNARAALAGNEITALLYQAGAGELAGDFRTVTIRTASDLLRDKGFLSDTVVVSYDPLQKRDVTTPAAKAALKDYQAETGLQVTGKWDLPTLNALAGP